VEDKALEQSGISQKPPVNVGLKVLTRVSYLASLWFERIAMVGLAGMIIATLIDVLGDKLFNRPMGAGTEAVYFLQVIAIAGALAFTKIDGKHIRLEFVDAFPPPIKSAFNFMAGILGLGLFVILSWKSYEYALSLKNAHEVTAASRIPLYPLVIWVSVSCIPLCLVLLKDIYGSAIEGLRK
jgi:TRAP-type C4-dicarboxylate transport system permease small subunit